MTRLKRKKELPSQHHDDVRFGTPQEVAQYREKRLSGYDTIIEIGAGAGFQTSAFVKAAKHVIAIDVDRERLGRGKFSPNVIVIPGDALDDAVLQGIRENLKGKTAIFLDPERPPSATERTLDEIKPNIGEFIKKYGAISQDIAIELPPFLKNIPFDCEREYLSINGKLNRLTIYLGKLKKGNVSVVQLPSASRIASNTVPEAKDSIVTPKFILEPDAALEQAGLAPLALNIPYQKILLGKKAAYLTETIPKTPFFKTYRIVAMHNIEKRLVSCKILTLHGSMSEEEQKTMLKRLNRFCKGKKRMHLFVGKRQYLAELTTEQ